MLCLLGSPGRLLRRVSHGAMILRLMLRVLCVSCNPIHPGHQSTPFGKSRRISRGLIGESQQREPFSPFARVCLCVSVRVCLRLCVSVCLLPVYSGHQSTHFVTVYELGAPTGVNTQEGCATSAHGSFQFLCVSCVLLTSYLVLVFLSSTLMYSPLAMKQ